MNPGKSEGKSDKSLVRQRKLKDKIKALESKLAHIKVPPKHGYVWVNRQGKQLAKASLWEAERSLVYEMAVNDFQPTL